MENNTTHTKVLTIAIEDWYELSRSNKDITAKITLNGCSMEPLIRKAEDLVTIRPLSRNVKKGDIVLFRRADGQYVVHRVFRICPDTVRTMGDHCFLPDAPIIPESILGYVTHVQRGKRTICTDTSFRRFLGRVRLCTSPIRRMLDAAKRKLYRLLKGSRGRQTQ